MSIYITRLILHSGNTIYAFALISSDFTRFTILMARSLNYLITHSTEVLLFSSGREIYNRKPSVHWHFSFLNSK
jgi:hypothetical protein